MKRPSPVLATLSLAMLFACGGPLSAQSYRSNQPHSGTVTAIATKSDEQSFFSAGTDGFLVRWDSLGQGESQGERYQIGDFPINLLAMNPADSDVAAYESDGLSANRVSVYDWNTFTCRFAKRFKNTVTCLSYSANGTYLFVGTSSVGGTFILNAKTGELVKNIKTIPGAITMAKTGESEKSAIMYSPAGYLYYWDMKKGNVKVRFSTESSLEQPCLFGSGKYQNRFFAGVKGNTIYVIDATTGETLASYNATNPMLASCNGDYEEGLFYVSDRGQGYSLSLISNESLEAYLRQGGGQKAMIPSSSLVKNFMGHESSDSFCSIAKNQERIILGSKGGDIYTFSDVKESEAYSLEPITQGKFGRVNDIAFDGTDFYALASGKIYRMDFGSDSTDELASSPAGMDSMAAYGEDFILWSSSARAPVYRLSRQDGTSEQLFTAGGNITKLHLLDDEIIYLQGNSSVHQYSFKTGKTSLLYSGTSIEDAMLVGSRLYVAKSVANANESDMMSVDLKTKETVPIKTAGTVAFSLSYGGGKNLYGVEIEKTGDDEYQTQVFSYDTEKKAFQSLLRFNAEDSSACTQISGDELYTNIGRMQVYAYNLKTNRRSSFRRSSSLPVKVVGRSSLQLSVLNQDGSISWYGPRSKTPLSCWYLTDSGEWQSD